MRKGDMRRSSSAIDLSPMAIFAVDATKLRRTKSTSSLIIKEKKKQNDVNVDHAFFEKYWKRGNKFANSRIGMLRRSKSVSQGSQENVFNFKPLKKKISRESLIPQSEEGPKSPRPILRRSKSVAEADKKALLKEKGKDGPSPEKKETSEKIGKIPRLKSTKTEDPKSPSKETTINGIPLSKLSRVNGKSNGKAAKVVAPLTEEQEQTVEEKEKEGARNFARCLLGILPTVLSSTEPLAADVALQQFASDVCEAVTCLALKRKNVPNFGSVRKHDIGKGEEQSRDPSLNGEGVYLIVYATLKLAHQLNKNGYYRKKGVAVPMSQV